MSTKDRPAWQLQTELTRLPGIGLTRATKLLGRKRPRLLPIYDADIAKVVGDELWEPLRRQLQADNRSLHRRLLSIRSAAQLPDHVSAVRVFDVITWMTHRPPPSVL